MKVARWVLRGATLGNRCRLLDKGISTEALKAFLPKAAYQLQRQKITATANIGHHASIAVLKKLGFELLGEKEDVFGPYWEFEFTYDEAANEKQMA